MSSLHWFGISPENKRGNGFHVNVVCDPQTSEIISALCVARSCFSVEKMNDARRAQAKVVAELFLSQLPLEDRLILLKESCNQVLSE